MQNGPRGRREREFYEKVRSELRSEKAARMRSAAQAAAVSEEASDDEQASISGRSDDESDAQIKLPFSTRNAAMLAAVPSFREFLQLHNTTALTVLPKRNTFQVVPMPHSSACLFDNLLAPSECPKELSALCT